MYFHESPIALAEYPETKRVKGSILQDNQHPTLYFQAQVSWSTSDWRTLIRTTLAGYNHHKMSQKSITDTLWSSQRPINITKLHWETQLYHTDSSALTRYMFQGDTNWAAGCTTTGRCYSEAMVCSSPCPPQCRHTVELSKCLLHQQGAAADLKERGLETVNPSCWWYSIV